MSIKSSLADRGWMRWEPKDDNYDNDACNYAADQSQSDNIFVHPDRPNEAISYHSWANEEPNVWRHHVVLSDDRYFAKFVKEQDLESHLDSLTSVGRNLEQSGFRHIEYNRWTRT